MPKALFDKIASRLNVRRLLTATAALVVCTFTGVATAQVEYKVAGLLDFTGPYADMAKPLLARDAVIAWWNDNDGKKLGIKLTVKEYDSRYDATVVASLWPRILTELKPIVAFGMGGADQSALQQRVAKDQVPVIYYNPGYGFSWLPNQWVFNTQPTYVHQYLTAIRWYAEQNPQKRPIRIAFLSTQASPVFVDLFAGIKKYVQSVLEPKGIATLVADEWVEIQPVDLTSQMRKIIDAKADIILGSATTAMAVATVRAQEMHGVNIPTLSSPWLTIWPAFRATKSYALWENHMVVVGSVPTTDRTTKAWDFYQMLSKSYGQPPEWDPLRVLAMSQGLVLVRSVERAAKKVGADKITGKDIYEALSTATFSEEELMGVLPTTRYTKDAPFPQGGEVKVEWVKDGKFQLATPKWLAIPTDITKW